MVSTSMIAAATYFVFFAVITAFIVHDRRKCFVLLWNGDINDLSLHKVKPKTREGRTVVIIGRGDEAKEYAISPAFLHTFTGFGVQHAGRRGYVARPGSGRVMRLGKDGPVHVDARFAWELANDHLNREIVLAQDGGMDKRLKMILIMTVITMIALFILAFMVYRISQGA